MRLSNPELPLLAVLPIALIGLGPLLLLPMVGALGLAVIGLLIGSSALMVQLEEDSEHDREIVAHGFASGGEQAAHRSEMRSLLRELRLAKLASAGLIAAGFGGFWLGH
jgi:hypothetical protein